MVLSVKETEKIGGCDNSKNPQEHKISVESHRNCIQAMFFLNLEKGMLVQNITVTNRQTDKQANKQTNKQTNW